MSRLDEIANHIGSPYGEGATYNKDNDASHLDNSDYVLFKQEIKDLFKELISHHFNQGGEGNIDNLEEEIEAL